MIQIIGELFEMYSNYVSPSILWLRRTIEDKYSGKQMLLSDQELDIVQKIQQREFPEASVDPYPVSHMYLL